MNLSEKEDIANIYRYWANNYNLVASLYDIIFGSGQYRKQAIEALNLQPGDTVIDLCCGTGLNFPILQQAVGAQGRIIGVDFTDAMLEQAHKRVKEAGWSNVELVQSDVAKYEFPTSVDGVISTFALTLVPEFDKVILNSCKALSDGKCLVVLDLRVPFNLLAPLAPLLNFLFIRPFGGRMEMASRHPWNSIHKYLENVHITELYMGFVYIAVGKKFLLSNFATSN